MNQINLYEQMIQHDLFLNPGSSKFEAEEKIKDVELEAYRFIYERIKKISKYIADKISRDDIIFDFKNPNNRISIQFSKQDISVRVSYYFGRRFGLRIKVSDKDLSIEEFADKIINDFEPILDLIVEKINKEIDFFQKVNYDVSYSNQDFKHMVIAENVREIDNEDR